MRDDDFDLWLGRIGSDRPLRARLRAGVNRAGGKSAKKGASRFTGSRIGRGAGVGCVLASRGPWTGRRAVVKARIVKLGAKGAAAAIAHLRYLQRDGTTREGERGGLYGPQDDAVDGREFLERGAGDRHQFRFIVSPEDGEQYDELRHVVRRWMNRVEQDLGTRLDWVAVDHFNTGHPHAHVVVRGKDDLGKDLVLARDYMTHGLRERLQELVELDLGPRSLDEIRRAQAREVGQHRLTGIDRSLLRDVGEDGLVCASHPDAIEQTMRAGRLQTLKRMDLATEEQRGAWRLDSDLENTLRKMGERGDIIRTMQREMRARVPERAVTDYAICEPHSKAAQPVVGKVIVRGLSDEHADRHYLIVDSIDGISRYVDVGTDAAATPERSLVRIVPGRIEVRPVDHTIAQVAAASGGIYSVDAHLRHDPSATSAFAGTHVRRLEAMRRGSGLVERNADGTWTIAPDHLERVETWQRATLAERPVAIEVLADRPLSQLARHDGVTWLDRELASDTPTQTGRGFGAEVRQALAARQRWLVEQDLAEQDGETVRVRANYLATLQQRELRRVATQLGRELDLPFAEARPGQMIDGTYRRAVQVGDAKYALVERSRDFTLVPWKPSLERAVGKTISGLLRESGSIAWTIGRSRGPQIE